MPAARVGTHVEWLPGVLVIAAAIIAALPPLHEVDLAQHLATGEWIVRHRAVPFTEPFAWTRAGEPYFAYSWLMQVTYFLLLDSFGPWSLHLLGAVLSGGAVAAAYWAGRQFQWRTGTCAALAALHVALLWGVAGTLRPQQVLFVVIPLAWGIAARIRHHGLSGRRLLALAATGSLAANSHIFFPVTIVPVAYFLLSGPRTRTWITAAGALVAGWLVTPYALAWPQVFELNFGHNVLLGRPPAILEFLPGVEYAMRRHGVILAAAALLAAPWIAGATALSVREKVTRALCWTAGLVLFAFAGRLIVLWWALAFPLVGAALARIATASTLLPSRRARMAVSVGAIAIIVSASAPAISPVFWLFEGDTVHRMLPRAGQDPALWLPSWLLCNTRPDAGGRIFTDFNYGSELNWRLPGYSPSIDGRTIFPDSIAREFAFHMYGRRRVHASTWEGADLALLDRSFWLAPVLDEHPEWLLLAQGRPTSRGSFGALWARREWWEAWGSTLEVPAIDVHPGDARGTCEATGRFPSWGSRSVSDDAAPQ
jgi:hypothetical protein